MPKIKDFSEMEVITILTKDLIPYENNPKEHSDDQVRRIATAITEAGVFKDPIDIDESNVIINGHGRLKAAKLLGLKHVPAKVFRGLSEEEKRAMRVRDNQVAKSTYDDDKLRSEIMSLADLYSLDNLGFDDGEIDLDFGEAIDLTDLGEDVDPIDESPVKSPKQAEYKQAFQIVIDCEDEAHQEKLYMKMTKEGLKCKVLSM